MAKKNESMILLDVLAKEILDSRLIAELTGDFVRLCEPASPLKEIKVHVECPDRTLALRIDKAKVNGLFRKGRGQLRRCDCVIFTEVQEQKYLVFIEMKHKNNGSEGIVQQFKGAECLVDYIASVLDRFYKEKYVFNEYKKRFVLFYKASIPKKTTRLKKQQKENDVPERYLRKLAADKLWIGELV
ncbi:MAG: hypothetical protein JRI39_13785 [Deltaproteobacteria bacterium]|nr:hypothetical protein [Deltaproteobacteria bacterium]